MDCPVVSFYNLGCNIQSESGTFLSLMTIGIIGLEYLIQILGGDSVAVICNMYRNAIRLLHCPDSDTAAIRCIDPRIIDNVLKCLPQIELISPDIEIVRDVKLQLQLPALQTGCGCFGYRFQKRAQIDRSKLHMYHI